MRIAALVTCFNRREKTLACLATLERCFRNAGVEPSGVLFDDGCTDDTAGAVQAGFPWMRVVHGDGNFFWNRGMHRAWREAMQDDFDAYLWINDDVTLYDDALARAVVQLEVARSANTVPTIVIGSMRWPDSDRVAYGGLFRPSRVFRIRLRAITPSSEPQECDTMNGNFVLVPRDVVQRVGILDPVFEHGLGDFDYGLRAFNAGCRLLVLPGYVGECPQNPLAGTFHDKSLTSFARLRRILDRQFLPPRSWLVYTYRHGGPMWPAFWVWPYLRVLLGR